MKVLSIKFYLKVLRKGGDELWISSKDGGYVFFWDTSWDAKKKHGIADGKVDAIINNLNEGDPLKNEINAEMGSSLINLFKRDAK